MAAEVRGTFQVTDKARRWLWTFLGLFLVYVLLVFTTSIMGEATGANRIGKIVGSVVGAAFGGAVVALILRFFWKKHTLYELWFSSSTAWFGLFLIARVLGVQQ